MTVLILPFALALTPDSTLFSEMFDGSELDVERTWSIEGTGSAWIEDGKLNLREDSAGIGLVAWLRPEWPGDVRLSFTVEFSNNRGIGVFFLAATGPDSGRTGDYDEYIRGELDNYSFSFHRYFPDGANNPGANSRRNPGFNLLHQAMPDPMLGAETVYAVEIAKRGAHIVVSIDGAVVHDFIDDGSHGAPLGAGRIGFRLRGDSSCVMRIDDVKIERL